MAQVSTQVSDLRGKAVAAREAGILEDPSGRRGRRLRMLGRGVAILLTLWLVALLLGAVGIKPVGSIPFVHALKPPAPSADASLPEPTKASRADLRPALPANSHRTLAPGAATTPAGTNRSALQNPSSVKVRTRKRATKKGTAIVVGPLPKRLTTPPLTGTNNGQGQGVPAGGNTKTTTTPGTSHGNSGTAPGQTRTTTGNTTAPGQTRTTPQGHGKTDTTTTP